MGGGPNTELPLSVKALASHRRVPCSTVLLRVKKAPRDEHGIVLSRESVAPAEWASVGLADPVPTYESGTYDSTGSIPEGSELKLYAARQERMQMGVTTIREILNPMGYMGSLANDGEIQAWVADRLKPDPEAAEIMLDYAFLARYVPELGFRIAVDGVVNIPNLVSKKGGSGYATALFSLSPPASFYHPSAPLTSGVEFTTQRDFGPESTIRCPLFTDGYKNFTNVGYNPYLVAIIEVFGVGLKKKHRGKVIPCGFAILPVFSSQDQYVQSGAYRLPLFQGRPTSGLLEKIFQAPAYNVLAASLAGKEVSLIKGASVLVRVVDTQRDDSFREPRAHVFDPFVTSLVSNPAPYVKKVKSKPVRTLAKGMTPLEWERDANQVFANALGVEHYSF